MNDWSSMVTLAPGYGEISSHLEPNDSVSMSIAMTANFLPSLHTDIVKQAMTCPMLESRNGLTQQDLPDAVGATYHSHVKLSVIIPRSSRLNSPESRVTYGVKP